MQASGKTPVTLELERCHVIGKVTWMDTWKQIQPSTERSRSRCWTSMSPPKSKTGKGVMRVVSLRQTLAYLTCKDKGENDKRIHLIIFHVCIFFANLIENYIHLHNHIPLPNTPLFRNGPHIFFFLSQPLLLKHSGNRQIINQSPIAMTDYILSRYGDSQGRNFTIFL